MKSDHLLSDQWAEELLRNTCQSRFQALEDENRFKMDSILHALERKDMTTLPGGQFSGDHLGPAENDLNWAGEFLSGASQGAESNPVSNEVDNFFGKPPLSAFSESSQWAQDYLEKTSSVGVIGGSRIMAAVAQQPEVEGQKTTGKRSIWSADFLDTAVEQPLNAPVELNLAKPSILSLPPIQPHFLMNGVSSSTYDAFANAPISLSDQVKQDVDKTTLNAGVASLLRENASKIVQETLAPANDREDDELDYWNHMAEEFKKRMNENPEKYDGFFDSPEYELPGLLEGDESGQETAKESESDEYVFSEELKKADEETLDDAFELGMKHLKEGDLPFAVTYFEVACFRQPDVSKHWQYLGIAQAQNEYDLAAIRALKRCLQLEPENLSALMALAVCYTNERMEAQACDTLKRWMLSNPKYNCLLGVEESISASADTSSALQDVARPAANAQFGSVKEMFITAARLYPYEPDADVQCGLGVLFNISGEYEKAIDCFRCALNVRPDDPALWNRLGASLANDGQSASAIAAYRRSLELNPGFNRTRFNIGISCISLGAYKEAVEHFLTVLNLQRLSAANDKAGQHKPGLISQNVWNSLRYVLSMMQRRDLYPRLERRDLDFFNREFGIEF